MQRTKNGGQRPRPPWITVAAVSDMSKHLSLLQLVAGKVEPMSAKGLHEVDCAYLSKPSSFM